MFTPSRRVRSHSRPLVSSPVRLMCTSPAQRWESVLQPIITISPAFSRMISYIRRTISAVVRERSKKHQSPSVRRSVISMP